MTSARLDRMHLAAGTSGGRGAVQPDGSGSGLWPCIGGRKVSRKLFQPRRQPSKQDRDRVDVA
jgi:hypothetical protein